MDSAYLQRIRFQIQKRVRRLNSCSPRFFHSPLVQFWNYLQEEPLTAGILAKLDAEAPPYTEEVTAITSGNQEYDLAQFDTEAEQAHFVYRVIRYCATTHPPRPGARATAVRVGYSLTYANKDEEALDQFREVFLEPFYEYIDEALDQQGAVLSLLIKYRHKVEWFERKALMDIATSGERTLAKHLYAYLFDQGLDFHIEPQSASGEADLVSPDLVLDAKVFDGERRSLSYLRDGVHQVHTYARDFNQQVGYLVVYKTCPETLDFTFSTPDHLVPYVVVGGKTIGNPPIYSNCQK